MTHFILFGFKGCGKTFWGQCFAHALEMPFIDTDRMVCELYGEGRTCREIYEAIGAAEFRRLERLAVASLEGAAQSVIALGGGTILCPENRAVLAKTGLLIYLKASYETLKSRILKQPLPAFLDPRNPEEAFENYYLKTLPLYQCIPARMIDVDAEQVIHQFKEAIAYGQ